MTTVLAVVAHPDDEVLGCGGTLARHAAEGADVYILILAEGATSRDVDRNAQKRAKELDVLRTAAKSAAKAIGAHPPNLAGLPDNRMDSLCLLDVIKCVEDTMAKVAPDVIYTHHGGDLNIDHRMTHEAVLTAARPLPGSCVKAIYAFETLSSTEWSGKDFRPTRFVDISEHMAAKNAALACYTSEMRPFPHPRSLEAVEALARLRGASSGVTAAEAFEVVRERI
ncbi:MAG: GlcNAc-PI de-N-acetylase [Alphaproteobacteria bacterium RIFOXYD12_FULL_60_8]|nr:MAG: GlcNAc-PI de-N-acetylase [Alphaproteobacteria bacterium RIFOXYD12_FULL_60_8]